MLAGAVVLGLAVAASAQVYNFHPYGFNPYAFAAAPAEEVGPEPCPQAPARPEGVDGCNWIPIQNNRGCILDYECEPKGPEPCPPTPMQPEESRRCKWTAIKNAKGCIIDFECEPRRSVPLPAAPYGYPYGYHVAAPAAPAVSAQLGGFDYGYWQRYFQAALQKGMAQQPQPQAQTFQSFQGQGQQFGQAAGQGFAQAQTFGQGQQTFGQAQNYGQAFQGQGQQAFQGFGQQGQGQQQGFGQAFQGQAFQGQGQNSYRPNSGVVAPVQPEQEYVWVYPETTSLTTETVEAPVDTPDAVAAEGVVVIPTGEETIPTEISGGMPLTTGIRTRGAGSPRKVKRN